MKVLSNFGCYLMIRHLVRGFNGHNTFTEAGFLEPVRQSLLGLPGAEYEDGLRVGNRRDDRIVVHVEISRKSSLTVVIGRYLLSVIAAFGGELPERLASFSTLDVVNRVSSPVSVTATTTAFLCQSTSLSSSSSTFPFAFSFFCRRCYIPCRGHTRHLGDSVGHSEVVVQEDLRQNVGSLRLRVRLYRPDVSQGTPALKEDTGDIAVGANPKSLDRAGVGMIEVIDNRDKGCVDLLSQQGIKGPPGSPVHPIGPGANLPEEMYQRQRIRVPQN